VFSEFAAAASGHLAGIACIRPLNRTALEHSEVVKNHVCINPHQGSIGSHFWHFQYNADKTAGTANAISLADVATTDEPSFFTRGVGNSTAPSQITMYVHQLNLVDGRTEM
jgi:hypothetical protein